MEREKHESITYKEIMDAIKSLKLNTSTGPDGVACYMLKNLNKNNIEILRHILDALLKEIKIPDEWKLGRIVRIYKNKGKKGQCSNERGITISSNVGKILEKILKERMEKKINITQMQGGGKKKIGTVDHLLIVNNTLNKEKKNKKSFHIVFLDVEKAYDKAWLQGILDVLYRNGLQDRQWCYFMKLNEDNKAVIDTHVGDTREISIKNTLRQGSALSGIAYSALTDEIAKECEKQDMGYIICEKIKIPCLL